jgi:hypothetical protein
MKVLFLDIDGVLNNHERHENGYAGIRSDCVSHLNHILKEVPDLKIVISSAWRYMIPEALSLKGFEYLLLVAGVNCEKKVIGYTARDENVNSRGKQIRFWVKDHMVKGDKYIILDDLPFDFLKLNLNFILTDPKVGLTRKKAEAVIERLKA